MLGALATGATRIAGLLEADDVLNTAQALAALGAGVEQRGRRHLARRRAAASAGCASPPARSTSATPAPARG